MSSFSSNVLSKVRATVFGAENEKTENAMSIVRTKMRIWARRYAKASLSRDRTGDRREISRGSCGMGFTAVSL